MNDDQKAHRVHNALRTATNDDPKVVHMHSADNLDGPCACGARPPGKAQTVANPHYFTQITCPDCREKVREYMGKFVDKALGLF